MDSAWVILLELSTWQQRNIILVLEGEHGDFYQL